MSEPRVVVQTEQFWVAERPRLAGVGYTEATRSYYIQRGRSLSRLIRDGDYVITYADRTWDVVPKSAGEV